MTFPRDDSLSPTDYGYVICLYALNLQGHRSITYNLRLILPFVHFIQLSNNQPL
jgi:hypothetical protein